MNKDIQKLLNMEGRGDFAPDAAFIEFIGEFPEFLGKIIVMDPLENGQESTINKLDALVQAMHKGDMIGSLASIPNPIQYRQSREELLQSLKRNHACTLQINDIIGRPLAWVIVTKDSSSQAKELASNFSRANPFSSIKNFPVLPEILNDNAMWHEFTFNHEAGHALTMNIVGEKYQIQRCENKRENVPQTPMR
jgi:hypothetical protein